MNACDVGIFRDTDCRFRLIFGVAAVATDFSSMKSAMLAILSGVSWGGARLLLNVCMPAIRAWIYCRNILADAVCGAGDERGRFTGAQREIDWQPTVFWALAYSAIRRQRWRGAYGCLY